MNAVEPISHVSRGGSGLRKSYGTIAPCRSWGPKQASSRTPWHAVHGENFGEGTITVLQPLPNLCFYIRYDLRSHRAFQCIRAAKHRHTIFHARVGLVRVVRSILDSISFWLAL
jgi:hypothetical protein